MIAQVVAYFSSLFLNACYWNQNCIFINTKWRHLGSGGSYDYKHEALNCKYIFFVPLISASNKVFLMNWKSIIFVKDIMQQGEG